MESAVKNSLSESEVISQLFYTCQDREPSSVEEAEEHLKTCQRCSYRMSQRQDLIKDGLISSKV